MFAPRSAFRAERASRENGRDADIAARQEEEADDEDDADEARHASSLVASAGGTSPERGSDSDSDGYNAAPSGPRMSLGGDGVKPSCGRLEWAELLRRVDLVDALACPCVGRRTERAVLVAGVALLELLIEAPPLVRARSPGFDFAERARAPATLERAT